MPKSSARRWHPRRHPRGNRRKPGSPEERTGATTSPLPWRHAAVASPSSPGRAASGGPVASLGRTAAPDAPPYGSAADRLAAGRAPRGGDAVRDRRSQHGDRRPRRGGAADVRRLRDARPRPLHPELPAADGRAAGRGHRPGRHRARQLRGADPALRVPGQPARGPGGQGPRHPDRPRGRLRGDRRRGRPGRAGSRAARRLATLAPAHAPLDGTAYGGHRRDRAGAAVGGARGAGRPGDAGRVRHLGAAAAGAARPGHPARSGVARGGVGADDDRHPAPGRERAGPHQAGPQLRRRLRRAWSRARWTPTARASTSTSRSPRRRRRCPSSSGSPRRARSSACWSATGTTTSAWTRSRGRSPTPAVRRS